MVTCPERVDPRRTILGRQQRRWLLRGLDRDRILRFVWERQPANPIVLTGDIHAFLVSSGASKGSGFRKHLWDNPHIRFFENRLRGYTRCTVLRQRWYADLRVVDTVERPGAPGPHLGQLRRGNRSARRGTGLEWRTLTTTYGGAWVRP